MIRQATIADFDAIEVLVNTAYRGEASTKGWTTEAYIIGGSIRTDREQLTSILEDNNSVMLLYIDDATNCIEGCVELNKNKENKLYLGMLSVYPNLQGKGIGKQLLQASDAYAKHHNCNSVYMVVVHLRLELISWYNRHGYLSTGETKPFIVDSKYATPLEPLYFEVLEKKL